MPEVTGTISAKLGAAIPAGVAAIEIDVSESNNLVTSRRLLVPSPGDAGDELLAPDASSPVGDAYFVLPPGTYTVVARALDPTGAPSPICNSASASAMVAASMTTEVELALSCAEPNGGLDTVIAVSLPPLITGLQFDPGKFAPACQPVTITVSATDSAGVALSYSWTLISGPTTPIDPSTFLEPEGASSTFSTSAPGDYTLRVDATDANGRASLNFPLHILPGTCSTTADAGGATAFAPQAPTSLPLPPKDQGCYRGGANGWVAIPCGASGSLGPILMTEEAIETPSGTSPTVPFSSGQVDILFSTFGGETDSMNGANAFSVQGNPNTFTGSNGDRNWVQFAVQSAGFTIVKIETWDLTTFLSPGVQCPNSICAASCGCADYGVSLISNRPGGYNQSDFANVAGSLSEDSNGNRTLAMVAQFSWYDARTDPGAGLYAVVAPDPYGLAGKWTQFSGTVLGYGGGSTANFLNSSVETTTQVGACPACVPVPLLIDDTMTAPTSVTAESNNMCAVGTSTPLLTSPFADNSVFTSNLYSTSCCGGNPNLLTNRGLCCERPTCGGECCDQGTCLNGTCCTGSVDASGACCLGPVDAAGNCCSGGPFMTICGGVCCNGHCTTSGSCCPAGSEACGSECCSTSSGQSCLDAGASLCGAPTSPTLTLIDVVGGSAGAVLGQSGTGTLMGQSGGPPVRISNSQDILVNGAGFVPGAVTLTIDTGAGTAVGIATAGADGTFTVQISTELFTMADDALVATEGSLAASVALQVNPIQ